MGVLLLDEPFTVWIVLGTILVMTGVFWVTRPARV
jgi:drug/metabolite transporter (DMT)-like permease